MLNIMRKEVRKGNKRIKFIHNIRKVIESHGKVFILLEIKPDEQVLNNLYCFSSDLKILWRSSPIEEIYKDRQLGPYEDILIIGDKLYAYDFIGRRYEIDMNNGKVGEYRLFK